MASGMVFDCLDEGVHMNAIWRFPIEMNPDGRIAIEMPTGARILTIQVQERAPNMPSIWVLCDDKAPPLERHFQIIGTGHTADVEADKYVGTWQQGGFVWHLFEVIA